jgi:hypothetical protein
MKIAALKLTANTQSLVCGPAPLAISVLERYGKRRKATETYGGLQKPAVACGGPRGLALNFQPSTLNIF